MYVLHASKADNSKNNCKEFRIGWYGIGSVFLETRWGDDDKDS
jgi:hypothetical protein